MKTWIILFVLVTLATYCIGRTRFRMIEYDEEVDKTRAYKECMRECIKVCEGSTACKEKHNPDTLCREGSDDGFMVDGKLFRECAHLISHPVPQRDEPKRPFELSDLWRLFDTQ